MHSEHAEIIEMMAGGRVTLAAAAAGRTAPEGHVPHPRDAAADGAAAPTRQRRRG